MEDHQGLGDVEAAPAQPGLDVVGILRQAAIAGHNHYCPNCYPNTIYGQGDTGCPGFNEVDLGVAATILTAAVDSLKTAVTKSIWDAVEKIRFDGEHE